MVWVQYDLTSGDIQATNSQKVDDTILSGINRAQLEDTNNLDLNIYKVDVTQEPPILVLT